VDVSSQIDPPGLQTPSNSLYTASPAPYATRSLGSQIDDVNDANHSAGENVAIAPEEHLYSHRLAFLGTLFGLSDIRSESFQSISLQSQLARQRRISLVEMAIVISASR
jgi:hypothetical protein